jgi:hypothetical protein
MKAPTRFAFELRVAHDNCNAGVNIAKEVVLGDLHRLKSHRGFHASADVVAHSNGAVVDLELVGGVPFRLDRVAGFVLKPRLLLGI